MENITYKKIVIIPIVLLIVIACGQDTITQIIKVRVDTFISSISNNNNSELSFLTLSKSATREERVILRLPTNNQDDDDLFEDCFEHNLCTVFFMPLYVLSRILTSCPDTALNAANLISAILVLNTNDGSSIADGTLELSLLAKPWWHTVNWNRAHPFSSNGKWSTPGGDINSSTTFEPNCTNLSDGSCAAGEVKFELTDYFKTLIQNPDSTHYGILIYSNATLTSSKLYSAQANSEYSPRIVATYNCNGFLPEQTVFYLGTPIPKQN